MNLSAEVTSTNPWSVGPFLHSGVFSDGQFFWSHVESAIVNGFGRNNCQMIKTIISWAYTAPIYVSPRVYKVLASMLVLIKCLTKPASLWQRGNRNNGISIALSLSFSNFLFVYHICIWTPGRPSHFFPLCFIMNYHYFCSAPFLGAQDRRRRNISLWEFSSLVYPVPTLLPL